MRLNAIALLSALLLGVSCQAQAKTVTVEVSSDSEAKNYEAWRAMDGDPETMWHSEWQGGGATELPHDLIIDMGSEEELTGFIYQPRVGRDNGTIKDYEFYVCNDIKKPGKPVSRGAFKHASCTTDEKIEFSATKGRYVILRALSEIKNSKVFASVAELKLIAKDVEFKGTAGKRVATGLKKSHAIVPLTSEPDVTYNVLAADIKNIGRFKRYKTETFNEASSILDTDKDPLDIILRRTRALLDDIKGMKKAPELKKEEEALAQFEAEAEKTAVGDAEKRKQLFTAVHVLRREIAFKNPLLDFDKLLFIKRQRSRFNHMCDQYYGEFAVPGGGVFVLSDPFGDEPEEKNILTDLAVEKGRLKGTKLETGGFLSPELSYDGKTIYFAYVECTGDKGHITHLRHGEDGHWHRGRCYHIFKVNVDGSGLEQLTDGTWNEFDPCPLPNGRIAFISERRGGYLRCGRECPSYTVYDMKPDGSDIRMMSPHENNEWHPSVTHDGMIIYTRWDYVDRHGCTAHHPWIMTPDGRDSRAMHGNFSIKNKRADMEMDLRSIPGSHKISGTATPHHGQAYGSLIIYDPSIPDDDAMAPVKRITPDVAFPESQGGRQVYGTPWPLSENYYLCVYDSSMRAGGGRQGQKHKSGNYGIYIVDAFGNKVLVYRDPEVASLSPMPLRAREKPPIVPEKSERLAKNPSKEGTMAVMNVYDSIREWPEGTEIKALRIYQTYSMAVPSGRPPHETGRRIAEAGDSVNLARRIIGTVPVEEDGSAYFKVPALREVYFQALDKDGLAIQSMRSATWVQPGEMLTCQGCHEPKAKAIVPPKKVAIALKRKPSIPKPEADGTNPFSYPRLVQPVLDKKCVGCHTEHNKKLAAKTIKGKQAPLLDREIVKSRNLRGTQVYRSYDSLINLAFWSYGDHYRTIPGKFGAKASKLYQMLEKGHHDVKLTKEEMRRITVWLDSCSNFYGVYSKEGGEAQLRGEIAMPTLE